MQNHDLKQRARDLRKNATRQEQRLWYDFLRTYPAKFRRQQQIGPYIADFYCPSARVVIELDGSGHYEADGKEYDRWRDAYIAAQENKILRFTNTEIEKEFERVIGYNSIKKEIKILMRYIHSYVYHSIIHNGQDMETTQKSIDR